MLKPIKTLLKAAAHRFIYGRPLAPTPEVALMPELLVVADGYVGAQALKATRELPHIHVYWPGRGEKYLAGAQVQRVTISEDARRRLDGSAELRKIRRRIVTSGDTALWLEV